MDDSSAGDRRRTGGSPDGPAPRGGLGEPPALRSDRFYVVSDAGSLYFDEGTGEGADGFETPEAAAEWARRQTTWRYGSELDFSDGVTSVIVLGAEVTANEAAWGRWDGTDDWPDAPGVHNYARDLGLVTEEPSG